MSLVILNVDEVKRTLSASGGAFVVHDKEVDIVRFAINSGFADIVLDGQAALRVMYQRPGESQVRAQTLTYHDTDGLRNYYDWQLLPSDLAEKGTLTVALCILRTDSEVEEWHTTPCQIRVLDTIHTDDSDEGDESITPTVAQRVAVLETMIHKWRGEKWAAIGDSLTAVNTRATKRYHDYISEDTGITVVNLGVSGTGYKKPYNSGLPFWQRVNTIPADSDVITIFGSGNDLSQTLGTVTDTGTETICGCINTTIDDIRSTYIGANLGIITPTPWVQYPTTDVGNKMDLYADALVEICRRKGVPCLDLYHGSNMLPWEQAFREAYYTRDDGNGVHPDENGHKLFAPKIRAFLETLL